MEKTRNFPTFTEPLSFINIPVKPDLQKAAHKCFVNPMSTAVRLIFKLMYMQIET